MERFDFANAAGALGFYRSQQLPGFCFIETNLQRILALMLPSENVISRKQRERLDLQGNLSNDEIRVLTFGSITRSDQNHSGNEFPVPVCDSGGRAELRLDAFLLHLSTRRDYLSEFACCR